MEIVSNANQIRLFSKVKPVRLHLVGCFGCHGPVLQVEPSLRNCLRINRHLYALYPVSHRLAAAF